MHISIFTYGRERTMKAKMLIVSGVTFVIAAVFYCFYATKWCFAIAITASTVCYHFVMRLIVGYMVKFLSKNKSFNCNSFWLRQKKGEGKIYKFLCIGKWKNRVPTFNTDEFDIKNGLEHVINSSCRAEIVHEIIMALSFLPLVVSLLLGDTSDFVVFLLTSIFSALIDLVFVMLQRYNRPRLIAALEFSKRKKL